MRKGVLFAYLLAVSIAAAGCGSTSADTATVPVESVSLISSIYGASSEDNLVFDGIVTSGQESSIKKESGRSVAEVYVKTGDTVKEGDKLFTYDAAQAEYSLDTARLELEKLNSTLTSQQNTKAQYEKYMNSATGDDLLQYTLDVQKTETEIKETEYQIETKKAEIATLEASTENLDVTAPFGGKIEYAGTADASGSYLSSSDDDTDTSYSDTSDDDTAFIKIVDTDTYRVKGSVDIASASLIGVDMPLTIHSRTDDTRTWQGTVTEVSTDGDNSSGNTADNSTDDSDTSNSSSNFTFYVSLDSLDGLIIDQHVYMTSDADGSEVSGIVLPSSYINDADEDAWVWRDNNGVLEKASVSISAMADSSSLYEVTEGLSEEDHIAAASDEYSEGMECAADDGKYFQAYVDTLTDKSQTTGDDDEDVDEDDGDDTDYDDFDDGGDDIEEDYAYDDGDVDIEG